MRRIRLFFVYAFFVFNFSFFIHSNGQTISTIAGNGVAGNSGNGGPATATELNGPNGMGMDAAGNIYSAQGSSNVVVKVSSAGVLTLFAGNGTAGFSGDGGQATAAEISNPHDVRTDAAGNFYIADEINNRIRMVNSSGIISTFAGTGIAGHSGDGGPATAAELNQPGGVAIDRAGNVYIADYRSSYIRKVNTSGIISTIAGIGVEGYSGDGGAATSAEVASAIGVDADTAGNIYIADTYNYRVRKINTSGIISTIAGNGVEGYTGDGGAATAAEIDWDAHLCLDKAGNIYFVEWNNSCVRKINTSGIISTVAGNGTSGFSGDGGPATAAELDDPSGVAVSAAGNIYIDDVFNNRIREVIPPDTVALPCYSWKQKASLTAHGGRGFATGFSIGHYGFIGTGNISSGNTNDFWRWNQDSNTWLQVASYPGTGIYQNTSFTINGKGYSCLGYNGISFGSDLWEYDTTTNAWTQKASFPGQTRYGAFAFVIGTKAYVGCGDPGGPPYLQDFWVYDAIANTWTQLANFPGGSRAGLCAFTLNGYGYAGCGGNDVVGFNDLWRYDTYTNTWASMAPMPVPGSQDAAPVSFVIDSLAYVGTGQTISGLQRIGEFWSYNPASNSWTSIAGLPGAGRWYGVGFSIGNKGYAGTGQDSTGDFLPDFWEYSPCGDTTSLTGINQIKIKNNQLTIYPNPNNGIFTVSCHSERSEESPPIIVIYNMLGEKVLTETLRSALGDRSITIGPIDLIGQPNGVYFYRVISESGALVGEGKVIIEK